MTFLNKRELLITFYNIVLDMSLTLLASTTVVGDYINTIKTTFELNFDLN